MQKKARKTNTKPKKDKKKLIFKTKKSSKKTGKKIKKTNLAKNWLKKSSKKTNSASREKTKNLIFKTKSCVKNRCWGNSVFFQALKKIFLVFGEVFCCKGFIAFCWLKAL